MGEHILINSIGKLDHLRSIVRQELRDNGVKLPKSKKLKKTFNQSRNASKEDLTSNRIFGEHLCNMTTTFVPDHGYVPSFLIEASEVVQSHLDSEGIFRKSGSVNRQKELRQAIEESKTLAGANIYDVSVLVKQFFRELPEPLISPIFHDAFIRCYNLPLEKEPTQSILQLCLCLPLENIGALRFTLHMLNNIASHCDKNKMTANNLALIMAPNFMHSNKGVHKMNNTEEKILHIEVAIVEILIKNCKYIGMVSSSLQQQTSMMGECFGTDDDLDASDDNTLEDSKNVLRKKKRKRSGSLTGFVSSIASGIAKLRRSTDGRSINISSNTTLGNEMSMTSNMSDTDHPVFDSSATPCVMRKRRVSGEAVPFSVTKKKAILGNLPQKSALASTPFTPASTVKRNYHDETHFLDTSETPRLNCTTPCHGSKTSRKKLNLFTSPGSNKKVKRQASVARMNSPNPIEKPGKGRGILRRLSGSRDKNSQEESSSSDQYTSRRRKHSRSRDLSPRSAISDSALNSHRVVTMGRSSSSQSFPDSDISVASGGTLSSTSLNQGFIFEKDLVSGRIGGDMVVGNNVSRRSRSADRMNQSGMSRDGRSKSLDSPGLKRGQPNTIHNGLVKRVSLDKSAISGPSPLVVPVVADGFQVNAEPTSTFRRSRRDEFEEQKRLKKVQSHHVRDGGTLDKSVCSQLDESLMGAVLPPPCGFGDQTIVMEDSTSSPTHHGTMEGSDQLSADGFSTISGGTVLQRTHSGNYTNVSAPSTLTNSISSYINSAHPLRSCASKDSVFSDSSSIYSDFGVSGDGVDKFASARQLSGRLTDDSIIDVGGVEDTYVTLCPTHKIDNNINEGEYVTLKRGSCQGDKDSGVVDLNQKAMDYLRECYGSEEESSSSSSPSNIHEKKRPSFLEEMKKVSSRPKIHGKKSISAEDLKSSPRVNIPVRSRSVNVSPGKKFNYKPHLEISKETHKILTRAGYMKGPHDESHSKDVPVPVKSPKRSSHREEMMLSLRSSFHERINSSRLSRRGDPRNRSILSSQGSIEHGEERTSQICEEEESRQSSNVDTSLTSKWDKLLVVSEHSSVTLCDDKMTERIRESDSELSQRVSEIAERLQSGEDESRKEGRHGPETSEEEDSVQAKEPAAENISGNNVSDTMLTEKNTKVIDKSLTLSGFLDIELLNQDPLKIKRAQLTIQKHDSVVNIKEQKAGLVAENVKHFTHQNKTGKPPLPFHKRGTSPVRIPTIFAKSADKAKQYKEIAQFIRERSGQKDFMSLPQVPPTPKRDNTNDRISSDEDESFESKQNTTIVENATFFNASSLTDNFMNKDIKCVPVEPEDKQSAEPVIPKLSESLKEKVNLLCTPSKGSKAMGFSQEKDLTLSPLQESTNLTLSTLLSSTGMADHVRLRTAGGLTPHRLPLKGDGLSQRLVRPQLKRLKARSPRKVRQNISHLNGGASLLLAAGSPASLKQSKVEKTIPISTPALTSVDISLERKDGNGLPAPCDGAK